MVSKKRQGEGPEDYLSSTLTMGFAADGNIWVQTSMELMKYDLEFNLIDKERFEPKITVMFIRDHVLSFRHLTRNTAASFIVSGTNVTSYNGQEFIPSKVHMVEYYDAATKSVVSILPLSSRMAFKGIEDEVFSASVAPVFTVNPRNSDLYFTTSIDSEITVYNPINWNVMKRIPVRHQFFKALDDIPLRESNLAYSERTPLFSKNVKILKFDSDLVGLIYVKEITEAAIDLRKSEEKTYWLMPPEFHRLILFKNGVQLSGELTISSGLIQMALPNNRLLVKVVDLELDYIPSELWELAEN